jgi:hypothetical protein
MRGSLDRARALDHGLRSALAAVPGLALGQAASILSSIPHAEDAPTKLPTMPFPALPGRSTTLFPAQYLPHQQEGLYHQPGSVVPLASQVRVGCLLCPAHLVVPSHEQPHHRPLHQSLP